MDGRTDGRGRLQRCVVASKIRKDENEKQNRKEKKTNWCNVMVLTAYHPRCFVCAECKSEKLSGLNGFYVNGGRRYCVDCYNKNVAERCTGCGEVHVHYGLKQSDFGKGLVKNSVQNIPKNTFLVFLTPVTQLSLLIAPLPEQLNGNKGR